MTYYTSNEKSESVTLLYKIIVLSNKNSKLPYTMGDSVQYQMQSPQQSILYSIINNSGETESCTIAIAVV